MDSLRRLAVGRTVGDGEPLRGGASLWRPAAGFAGWPCRAGAWCGMRTAGPHPPPLARPGWLAAARGGGGGGVVVDRSGPACVGRRACRGAFAGRGRRRRGPADGARPAARGVALLRAPCHPRRNLPRAGPICGSGSSAGSRAARRAGLAWNGRAIWPPGWWPMSRRSMGSICVSWCRSALRLCCLSFCLPVWAPLWPAWPPPACLLSPPLQSLPGPPARRGIAAALRLGPARRCGVAVLDALTGLREVKSFAAEGRTLDRVRQCDLAISAAPGTDGPACRVRSGGRLPLRPAGGAAHPALRRGPARVCRRRSVPAGWRFRGCRRAAPRWCAGSRGDGRGRPGARGSSARRVHFRAGPAGQAPHRPRRCGWKRCASAGRQSTGSCSTD